MLPPFVHARPAIVVATLRTFTPTYTCATLQLLLRLQQPLRLRQPLRLPLQQPHADQKPRPPRLPLRQPQPEWPGHPLRFVVYTNVRVVILLLMTLGVTLAIFPVAEILSFGNFVLNVIVSQKVQT